MGPVLDSADHIAETIMLDLFYLALGLGTLGLFALYAASLGRI